MNKKELANILSKKINLIIKKKINDLHSPEINDVDVNSVKKCLKSSYVSTYGPFTKKFEKEIKKITKAKYVVALNSGTSALQLSLVGLKIPKNSEILMPSLTFVATANAVIYNQCIPHFVDTEKKSFGIDFDNLEKYIKFNFIKKKNKLYNKKTGRYVTAIIPVHLFGHAVDCKKLIKFSRKHNLKIIEDAAEALGSRYMGKHLGLFGDVGCLSFNGNKIVTTGAGGAIITNNKKIYKRVYHFANIAKKKNKIELEHNDIGFNYLMPNLNASLGISQIKRVKKFINNKRLLYKKYEKIFEKDTYFKIYKDQKNEKSNYWLQTLVINSKIKKHKNFFIIQLKKNNIGCRPVWKCLHLLPKYNDFPKMNLANSLNHYASIINLPSSYNIF